jgi:hypothetical protein
VSDERGPNEPESPPEARRRCQAIGTKGPCGMAPMRDSDWCFNHDPARAADRARARKLGGQRGNRSAAGPAGDPVPLRTVADVLALVEQVVGDAYAMDLSAERCRVLLGAAGQAMKAIEVGEIEARLEALEQRANLGRTA